MLKQESVLPVKTDMDTGSGMRIDILLCSCAAVFSRKAVSTVLKSATPYPLLLRAKSLV